MIRARRKSRIHESREFWRLPWISVCCDLPWIFARVAFLCQNA